MRLSAIALLFCALVAAAQPYADVTHHSAVLGGPRQFRLFLPPDYEQSGKRYPVIYYFHGHSDRYTLERYDEGRDTVPKIAAFVQSHPVIVVSVDGYVARDYTGFYGGNPWDVRREGGQMEFGEYFLELAKHVDAQYRTIATRRHRATAGLSMGGYMSLYLSARYPDVIGSASAFNPAPELFAGEPGRRSLWRPKDHVPNHAHTMVRLVRASGDYISQYHEETRAAYAASPVDFEYQQDQYHKHWATSIDDTFAFHIRAFANPSLDTKPDTWSYASAHRRFAVWGYQVEAACPEAAFVSLQRVTQGGLRVQTRRWMPDGPTAPCEAVTIKSAPQYEAKARYRLTDFDVATGRSQQQEVQADGEGRLTLHTRSGTHELSLAGPGTGAEPPVLLPLTSQDVLRVMPGRTMPLPIRVYNPRATRQTGMQLELASAYPTVEIVKGRAAVPVLEPAGMADVSPAFQVRFVAGAGDFARVRFSLTITYDDWHTVTEPFDVLVAPDGLAAPPEVSILDGRTATFSVFRQKGNQGGGASLPRTVTEGQGNGNGVLEPGETATIWLKLPQGVDPLDKNNWCRAKVFSDSPTLTETGDIQEDKQREWTGAQSRTSLLRAAEQAPTGTAVPVLLDCESWSFQYTPDVRYGKEPLYQAFQIHQHHLFTWTWQIRH